MNRYFEKIKSLKRNARLYLVGMFLATTGFGTFFVIFNIYLQEIGIAPRYIGLINGAPSMGIAIFSFFSGVISDRIGRKKSFLIGMVIESFSFFFIVTLKNPFFLIMANFIMGIGNSFFIVAESPFLLESSTEFERTHLFSFSFTAIIMGDFVGSLIGGFLPHILSKSEIIGMQRTLFAALLIFISSFAMFILIREDWKIHPNKGFINAVKEPFVGLKKEKEKIRIVLAFVLVQLFIGFGAGLVVPFFNLYFRNQFHLSTVLIGTIFSIGSIITASGTLLAPIIREKFGKLKGVVVTQSLSLPFILFLAFTKNIYVAVISYFSRGTAMNGAVPLERQLYMENLPEESRGALSSLPELSWSLSWALSASVAGFIIGKFGFTVPLLIMFVFYVLGIAAFYFGMRGAS